ncbi:MAG: hypothetical protein Q8939_13255 [Bacteroidota bacterium]|nr:hypothetical protein [Bacteroidota bacterium]
MTTQEEILKTASDYRGRMIQVSVEMETRMDIFISGYFRLTPEKQGELMLLVLGSVAVANKNSILEYILSIDRVDGKLDHRFNIKQYLKKIRDIENERNIFAHLPVDLSDEAQKIFKEKIGTITFVRMRPGSENKSPALGIPKIYDESRINAAIKKVEDVNKILNALDIQRHGAPSQV